MSGDHNMRGEEPIDFVEMHQVSEFAQAQEQAEPAAREGFEKWAKSLPNYMDISRFEAGYSDCNTDYAWVGWQAALAQPQLQAEPDELTVVYMSGVRDGKRQRQWVPLTEAEHTEIAVASGCLDADWVFYGAAVERALKERNAPDEAQQAMRDLLKTGTGVLLGGG